MSGQWCPDCGRWLMASHTCPPRWKVTDTDGETHVVYASSAIDAAEAWAYREDDGCIAGGGSVVTLEVRPMADLSMPPMRYTVHGEMVREYTVAAVCGTCDGSRVVEHVPHMGTMACDPADVRELPCPECGDEVAA